MVVYISEPLVSYTCGKIVLISHISFCSTGVVAIETHCLRNEFNRVAASLISDTPNMGDRRCYLLFTQKCFLFHTDLTPTEKAALCSMRQVIEHA